MHMDLLPPPPLDNTTRRINPIAVLAEIASVVTTYSTKLA